MNQISAARKLSVADFMAAANAHYYGTRDPLGAAGDFTTAPEISQMFGEMIGVWIADLWSRAGSPGFRYVELGPGRGTLASDALRAMARFSCVPQSIELVEASRTLRAAQLNRLPEARHHDDVEALPSDLPLFIIANEFFDALPIHQYVRTRQGWRERMVVRDGTKLAAAAGDVAADPAVPAVLRSSPVGTITESAPVAAAIMQQCSFRLLRQQGAMLLVDYGYVGPAAGDTLQAVKAHAFADPFDNVGEVDLTAHVDFGTLADVARQTGTVIAGPVEQGIWLRRLGIDARAARLSTTAPALAEEFAGQRDRLVDDDAMGRLFKVMAVIAPGWPQPEGFGGTA